MDKLLSLSLSLLAFDSQAPCSTFDKSKNIYKLVSAERYRYMNINIDIALDMDVETHTFIKKVRIFDKSKKNHFYFTVK